VPFRSGRIETNRSAALTPGANVAKKTQPFIPDPFVAEQLLHKDDVTIHLRDDAEKAQKQGGEKSPNETFNQFKEGLTEKLDTKSKPVFSIAQELKFSNKDGLFKARGLACLCERGKAISVTLRSIKPCDPDSHQFVRDLDSESTPIKSEFAPKNDYDKPPAWFSIQDQCKALGKLIIGQDDHPAGLVVICGSTNSAKSLIARGLIHDLLEKKVKKRDEDRKKHDIIFPNAVEALKKAEDELDKLKNTSGKPLEEIYTNPC
jgi:hypothetical protein